MRASLRSLDEMIDAAFNSPSVLRWAPESVSGGQTLSEFGRYELGQVSRRNGAVSVVILLSVYTPFEYTDHTRLYV